MGDTGIWRRFWTERDRLTCWSILEDVEGGEDYICALADCETHIIAGIMISFHFCRKKESSHLESIIYSSPMDIITMYLWELLG